MNRRRAFGAVLLVVVMVLVSELWVMLWGPGVGISTVWLTGSPLPLRVKLFAAQSEPPTARTRTQATHSAFLIPSSLSATIADASDRTRGG